MTRLPHFGQATPVLRYSNWITAALVTLSATYLHVLFLLNAGGLWRDEAVLVHLSLLPSVSEVWQNLPHDSCPILMHLAVRAWSAAGLGNTDLGLRVLGLFVGLFLLLAFWFASWTMRNGAPLLAVTLAGLNVTIIRAGDSLRGYGLGSALAVLTLAVIWRLTCRPSLAAFSCAVAVAVLSVQSLYQNAFFVFAACCGGFVLCAVERRWRDTLPIFAVGAAAAVSLLPYIPLIIRAQDWYIIYKAWFSFFARMEAALCGDRFPADGFHVGLGCIVDRRTRSGNFCPFLAPGSSSRPCPGPDSICGHQPRSWGGRLRFLSKASGAAHAAVALRAADGFFGSLPRRHVFRSVALGATCSDDPGGVNDFYDLSVRAARGEMPPD